MFSPSVRMAHAADAPGIARVHVDSWHTSYAHVLPAEVLAARSATDHVAFWTRVLSDPEHGVFVACDGDAVIGFASAGANRVARDGYPHELLAIYLLAAQQRRGIGRRLVDTLATHLGDGGIVVRVLEANPSRAFYQSLGGEMLERETTSLLGVAVVEEVYGWRDTRALLLSSRASFVHARSAMRVRCPLGICVYRTPDELELWDVGRQYAWPAAMLAQPGLAAFLASCAGWRDRDELAAALAQQLACPLDEAEATVAQLTAARLLTTEDDHVRHLGASEAAWRDHGWGEALVFHWHTNRIPKLDYSEKAGYSEDIEGMKKYVAAEPVPSSYKDYERAERIALPPHTRFAAPRATLHDALLDHFTIDKHADPLELDELSWFLYMAYGQTFVRHMAVTGKHVAKTVPSGGSRHPTEAYLVALDIPGLAPGAYHYSVRHHELETVCSGNHAAFLRDQVVMPGVPYFAPRAAVLFSTIFERSMFRYREARSYKVMHLDLGHVLQNSALLASSLGRSSYRQYASPDDPAVERFLGIDGIAEAFMGLFAIG